MSSKATNYFSSSPDGPNLRDFQHAARLYTDADQRLAPKVKFLYHVSFSINTNALKSLNFKYQHQNEINMLVKSAELPKFTVQVDTLNQYNRKRNTQVKVDYQPVVIKFHDDNLGVSRQLWENYFNYYYADSSAANSSTGYAKNATKSASFIKSRYGLDNNSSTPFFNDITIYQMSKRSWNSFKLINPIISGWNHDSLDYSASQPVEHSMTLAYEAVAYGSGVVSIGNPPGFALEHYDRTPSPIALAGGPSTGGAVSLGGAAGILAGAEAVFGAIGSGKAFESSSDFIATAITAVNTYQNAKALGVDKIKEQANGIVSQGINALSKVGLSGVQNAAFPINNIINTTVATAKRITGN